jgi:hypothetical protein
MASSSIYDAGNALGTQIMASGTAPELYVIVPKDYGNTQPPAARNYWVDVEEVEEYREAETANSYLQHFTLEVWVWIATPDRVENAASSIAVKLQSIYDKLEYNTLGGFARTALDNESLGRAKYVKGPLSTNARYGAHFTVKITKQVTVT